MSRSAIIVNGALGNAGAQLPRLGFESVQDVPTIQAATDALRTRAVDLIIVPIEQGDAAALSTLDTVVRQHPGTFVIGTAPRLESELLLRAMRAGVHEFLPRPPQEAELASAVARLTRRAVTPGRRGQVLAVYSGKGGLGCTTMAVNLATALAASGQRRVALVDLVVADGDVRLFVGGAGPYSVLDLVKKLDHADVDLLESLMPVSHGASVLPSPESPEVEDQIDGPTAERLLAQLRAHYDYVVVDTEHHLSPRTLAALDAADRVLLVTQLSVVALRSAQRTLALFRQLGYEDGKTAVVVNRYVRGSLLGRSDAARVLSREVFHSLPNDFERANSALTKGVPITAGDDDSKLAVEFRVLADRIAGGGAEVHALPVNIEPESSRLGRLFRRSRRA